MMSNRALLQCFRRLRVACGYQFSTAHYQQGPAPLQLEKCCAAPPSALPFMHWHFKSWSTDARTSRGTDLASLEDRELVQDDWTCLKAEWERDEKQGYVTFDSFVLHSVYACIKQSKHRRVKSLLDFAREESGTLPQRLFDLYCYYCAKTSDSVGVQWCIGAVRKEPSLLDEGNIRSLMNGICQGDDWKREALDLLAMGEGNIKLSTGVFEPLLGVASRNRDLNLVSSLLDDMQAKHLVPTHDACISIFNNLRCDSGDKSADARCQELVLNLLDYFGKERHYLTKPVAAALTKWFASIPGTPWKHSFTRISKDGKCNSCSEELEKIVISPPEFETLRKEVTEKVIFGPDIYQKTRPDEFEAFTQFVKEGGPYNIVVDGLNVANLNRYVPLSVMLRQVIVYLVQVCGYKVLVLGRQHMLNRTGPWKARNMDAIVDLADCFFTENISQDDPFMLYATLHSGPQCMYLTRDLLRDHKALLDPAVHLSFLKWQRTHQMHPVNFIDKKLICKTIRKHDTLVQSTASGWHIPFDDEDNPRYSYHVPINWVCMTKQ